MNISRTIGRRSMVSHHCAAPLPMALSSSGLGTIVSVGEARAGGEVGFFHRLDEFRRPRRGGQEDALPLAGHAGEQQREAAAGGEAAVFQRHVEHVLRPLRDFGQRFLHGEETRAVFPVRRHAGRRPARGCRGRVRRRAGGSSGAALEDRPRRRHRLPPTR